MIYKKWKTLVEKQFKDSMMVTNDGYIISDMFCNPRNVRKEINMVK